LCVYVGVPSIEDEGSLPLQPPKVAGVPRGLHVLPLLLRCIIGSVDPCVSVDEVQRQLPERLLRPRRAGVFANELHDGPLAPRPTHKRTHVVNQGPALP